MPDLTYDQLTPAQRAQFAAMFKQPWAGNSRRYAYTMNGSDQVISRRRLPAAPSARRGLRKDKN